MYAGEEGCKQQCMQVRRDVNNNVCR